MRSLNSVKVELDQPTRIQRRSCQGKQQKKKNHDTDDKTQTNLSPLLVVNMIRVDVPAQFRKTQHITEGMTQKWGHDMACPQIQKPGIDTKHCCIKHLKPNNKSSFSDLTTPDMHQPN